MKIIITTILGVLAIGATVYSGVQHGKIRHTNGFGQDLTEQVRLVESLPAKFGETEDGRPAWVMVGERKQLSDEVVELLECAGHYQASYRSTLHPEWIVQLLVMVGPSGPLTTHRPEACYPAAASQLISGPDRLEVKLPEGRSFELQATMFKQRRLEGFIARVGYAFSKGDGWTSPSVAREHFAGEPYLYKMQLHTILPSDFEVTEEQDPLAEFTRDFRLAGE